MKNKKIKSWFYSDDMIYSPDVPVFRDDFGKFLDKYYLCSFFTVPAVNKWSIQKNLSNKVSQIENAMMLRIEKMLALASYNNYDTLILWAWGCWVFWNDPSDVAHYFEKSLLGNWTFKHAFKKVVFTVLDTSEDKKTFKSFENVFGGL